MSPTKTATRVWPDVLTYAEASDYLRCSSMTVRRRVAEGLIPVHYIGPRQPRIFRTDLDVFLRSWSWEAS